MPLFPDKNAIPSWPTKMGKRWGNGMCQGTDRSIWLYRKVPLGPVDDAVDTGSMLGVADPMMAAFRELEYLTRARVTRRRVAKSMYREVHLLLVNVPKLYVPDDEQPLKGFLSHQHPRQMVDNRLLLFGVKIKDDLGSSGGWKGRIDSVVSTFSEDGVPMEDFTADHGQVERATRRAGLLTPTQEDFMLADAWWNLGRNADTPTLPHDDHLHVFSSHGAMSTAWQVEESGEPCEEWPKLPGHHKLAMLAYRSLEFTSRAADAPAARWVSAIRMQGAAAVSVRGLIEPARVTRDELRRNRNRFRSDSRELQAADKLERAEMEETSASLQDREAEYSKEGAEPTLIDASVIVALNGADESGRFDATGITPDSASWSNMLGIQDRALDETMLCSDVRSNPLLKDVPVATIAYSGLPSLSVVGDREGALLGFTERDHQPAYISHEAAYEGDSLPILLVAGATGSGKACSLGTPIPVPVSEECPDGWSTFGQIAVGDQVYGRDGRTTTVKFVTETDHDPDLYLVELSDGQTFKANDEHQWVVETWTDRHSHKTPTRQTAIAAWDEAVKRVEKLESYATTLEPGHRSSIQGVFEVAQQILGDGCPWSTWSGVRHALGFVEVPYQMVPATEMGFRPGQPVESFDTATALKGLSVRIQQSYRVRPSAERSERGMTTGEMFAEGVRGSSGLKFSIKLPEPFDAPEADLPVDPYVLGAWLGDGSRNESVIASARVGKCVDPETSISDQDHMLSFLRDAGYEATPRPANPDYVIGVKGLVAGLREAGVLGNKHIPATYLRASKTQRLALLQGIVDTDGTVAKNGEVKVGMTDEALIEDVLELVRSLGIKAKLRRSENRIPANKAQREAGITENQPSDKDMVWVEFYTDRQVARLPRKFRGLPTKISPRSNRLFVKKITPIEPEPVRCIQVDNGDHVFLAGGFVPHLNTMVLLYLAWQWAQMDPSIPQVVVDPKALTLDTRVPTPDGWKTVGRMEIGDQVFDRHGKPCNVTGVSRLFTAEETRLYEFVLDDGQVVRADQNHRWVVLDANARRQMAMHGAASDEVYVREMSTEDLLAAGVKCPRGQSNFSIPVAKAVKCPTAELPVEPYLLGAWLGDGSSRSKEIYCGDQDLEAMTANLAAVWPSLRVWREGGVNVISCGRDVSTCQYGHDDYVTVNRGDRLVQRCQTCESQYQESYRSGAVHDRGQISNPSLHHLLKDAGVLGDKHIPARYLTASHEQRVALLQGLMDTDGTVKRRGDLRITLCNEKLARGVLDLVRGLGHKATFWEGPAVISEGGVRRTVCREYVLTFRTHQPVFRLPRKRERQPKTTPVRSRNIYIKEIRPVASEAARCIQVDSPDHTYLVGDFVVTHNTGSDHTDAIEAAGGRVFSLDDLTRSDGVFDPLRFSGNAQAGVEIATSMLLQVDPWPTDRKRHEAELQVALKYGVDNGAKCIGQALRLAQEADLASDELINPVFRLLESSSFFRACVGMDPEGEGLRISNGISLIKVGNTHLDLPQPGKDPETMNQRIAVALVRMMVFGSAMAMTDRHGVLHFDEAWVAMAGGATEMERLGRLARSQTVLPVLYTQRVSDAVNNGLAGYISRGLIMHISDPEEAEAACALFKLEPGLRVPRITQAAVTGGSTADIEGKPEWSSLKALKDPRTGKVLRGSVAIYRDLAGRAVPVTVTLPPEFLALASTNPVDIKAKKLVRAEFEERQGQKAAALRSEELGSEEHRRMAQSGSRDVGSDVPLDPGEDLGRPRRGTAGAGVEVADDLDEVFSA